MPQETWSPSIDKLILTTNLLGGMQVTGSIGVNHLYNCEPCLCGTIQQYNSGKPQHRSTQPFQKTHLVTVTATHKDLRGGVRDWV